MKKFVKAQPSGQGTAVVSKERKKNRNKKKKIGFLHSSTQNNLTGDVYRWVLNLLNKNKTFSQ